MPRKTKKIRKANKKALAIVFAAALVITTVITGVVAVLYGSDISLPDFQNPQKAGISSSNNSDPEQPEVIVEKKQPPEELRAVMIKPGRDFSIKDDPEKLKKEINSALENAAELKMNTVVIDTLCDDSSLFYKSSFMESRTPGEEFDPFVYAIDAARQQGFYVMATYNITPVAFDSSDISALGKATSSLIDGVRADIANFAVKYQPDAVMLDG